MAGETVNAHIVDHGGDPMDIYDILKRSIGQEVQKRDSLRWYKIQSLRLDEKKNVLGVVVVEVKTGAIYHKSLSQFLDNFLYRQLPLIKDRGRH